MDHIYMHEHKTKTSYLWWQEKGLTKTATGYGKKIPTTQKLFFNGKWRRIYCDIFSNIGTCYIVSNKQKIIVRQEVKKMKKGKKYTVSRQGNSIFVHNNRTGFYVQHHVTEFIYGQIRYNPETDKYPNYVHLKVYELTR